MKELKQEVNNMEMEKAFEKASIVLAGLNAKLLEASADTKLDVLTRIGISIYIQNNRRGR